MTQGTYIPKTDRILRKKIQDLSEARAEYLTKLGELEKRIETVEGICEHWAKLGFDSAESELGRSLGEIRKRVSQLEKLLKRITKEAADAAPG